MLLDGRELVHVIDTQLEKLWGLLVLSSFSFVYTVGEEKDIEVRTFYLAAITSAALLAASFASCVPRYSNDRDVSAGVVDRDLPEDSEILDFKKDPSFENYHVLYKRRDISKESIEAFVTAFRVLVCDDPCNIFVYDDKLVVPLLNKYPLEKEEYLLLADHLVGDSTFDTPGYVSWYPYQDWKYRDYGGKNWKKDPIR